MIKFCTALLTAWLLLGAQVSASADAYPNIILIYGDDIGFGDFGCYGAKRIPTPNIDRLASTGLRFTSAYCTSATCTPSRYSMLTGEYAWRRKGTGIAPPNGSALILPGTTTLPSLLKDAGYETAIVGKWHLGLGRPPKPDWSGEIKPGPLEIGFDYCFLMPTTNDRVPCVYVENHHIVGHDLADPVDVFYKNPDGQPTGKSHRQTLKMDWSHGHNDSIVNGISRIGFMVGGHDIRWTDEEMSNVFVEKAIQYIERPRENPFFLFYSSQAIHVPRAPHKRFVGATPHGPRGDSIVEFDACVGTLVEALERTGILDSTLVIITSDNGPVLDDGYQDDAVQKLDDHRPAGPYRGGKYSIFEGGTRVPLIVYWPGKVKPGISEALISQVDFPATLAAIAGHEQVLPESAIPDSQDLSDTLTRENLGVRDHIIEHASTLAIRKGPWKYIAPSNGRAMNKQTKTELGNNRQVQLYHLEEDPEERHNLADRHPQIADELATLLSSVRKLNHMHTVD